VSGPPGGDYSERACPNFATHRLPNQTGTRARPPPGHRLPIERGQHPGDSRKSGGSSPGHAPSSPDRYAFEQTVAHTIRNGSTSAGAHADGFSRAHAGADRDSITDAYAHAYPNTSTHTHADADPYTHADSITDPHQAAYSHAHTNSHADAHADAHPHTHTDSHT